MSYKKHPFFNFDGPDIQGPMSPSERKDILDYENTLAEERDEKARQFQLDMERKRKQQEKEIRKMTERSEAARVSELEEQEEAAADYAESDVDVSLRDRDRRVTQMWSALSGSQEDSPLPIDSQERRPE